MRPVVLAALFGALVCGCNEPAAVVSAAPPPRPSCDGVSDFVESKNPKLKRSDLLSAIEKRVCYYSSAERFAKDNCSIPYDAPPLFGTEAYPQHYGLKQSTIDALADAQAYFVEQEIELLKSQIATKQFADYHDTDACLRDMHDISRALCI